MEHLAGVRCVEEFLDRAWPPRETGGGDDWVARFSDGMHRRLNSATVWAGDLHTILGEIEQWYAARDRPPLYRITEASHPGLEAALDAAGYRADSGVLVMTRALGGVAPPRHPASVAEHRDPSWIDAYARIAGYGPRRRTLLEQTIERIAHPCGFASIDDGASAVAVGLAVVEDDHAGLFEIAVDAARRRRGLGTRLVATLLAWAREQGAGTAHLQVFAGNRPALALYETSGFASHHRYWYRIPPGGLPPGPR